MNLPVQPMNFRSKQIEYFVNEARQASRYEHDGDLIVDAYIDMVLDEVEERLGNLSNVRVLIHNYIETELQKEPESFYFNNLRASFKPIFEYVIEIEKKMYGVPFYQITDNKAPFDVEKLAGIPFDTIHNVKISEEIINMMNHANDLSVSGFDKQIETESEENIPYSELPEDKQIEITMKLREESVNKNLDISEDEWLDTFMEFDDGYSFIEDLLNKLAKPRPVNISMAKQLFEYLTDSGKFSRSIQHMRYEQYVRIPNPELEKDTVLAFQSPANSLLFTILGVTNVLKDSYIEYLKSKPEDKTNKDILDVYENNVTEYPTATNYIVGETPFDVINGISFVLTKLICRLPLVDDDTLAIKIFIDFFGVNKIEELWKAFEDTRLYYGEKNFFKSENVALAMEAIVEEHYYVVNPKALQAKKEAEEKAAEEAKAQALEAFKRYNGDDDINSDLISN